MRLGEHSIPSGFDGGGEGAPVGHSSGKCLHSDRQVGGDAGLAEECGQLVQIYHEGASRRRPAREEIVASLTLFGCRLAQCQPPNKFTTEFQPAAQGLT
jgi:hypothetical protein